VAFVAAATTIVSYSILKRFKDPKDRISALGFASDLEVLPLQAADLLANRHQKIFKRKLHNLKVPLEGQTHLIKEKSWDDELRARGNVFTPYYTREELEELMARMSRESCA
jgi:hypothetical protein